MLLRGRTSHLLTTPLRKYKIRLTSLGGIEQHHTTAISQIQTREHITSEASGIAPFISSRQGTKKIHLSNDRPLATLILQTHKMADEAILAGKYPAKQHAKRVAEWMRKSNPKLGGVLYLEGQKTRMIEDNDEAAPFRYVCSPPHYNNPSLTNSPQTATVLLLPNRLSITGLVPDLRYRDREVNPLYPSHRSRIRYLGRSPRLRRRGFGSLRCRLCPHYGSGRTLSRTPARRSQRLGHCRPGLGSHHVPRVCE